MIGLKKHIAFLLLGIFFFPILFQSVHVVWHHSYANKSELQHCCHSETCDTPVSSTTENISQDEETCQVCEYQFSLNDLPGISIFRSIVPAFFYALDEVVTQHPYKPVFTEKSPRAPPVLIS